MKVTQLRCNYLENPIGIDDVRLRLCWRLETGNECQVSGVRRVKQTAYQVVVASSAELLGKDAGDLWDSGKVDSQQSIHVRYQGKRLKSFMRCYWKVRVWLDYSTSNIESSGTSTCVLSEAAEWSEPAVWEMGLLRPLDWKAKWIRSAVVSTSPILRREFILKKPVKSARAYISGLGYYELYINGKKIGDHVLDPGVTRYDVRVLYVTHDITSALAEGANAVGIMLGNGWYNCHTKDVWNFPQAPWRDRPKVILQMRIEFADGTLKTLVSDISWKASTGPVVFDGLRNGEIYDAREEKLGWNMAGYDDSSWKKTQVIPAPGGVLVAQAMQPIRVMKTILPLSVTEVKQGVFVYDMGQAFSGWAQLSVSGPAGTKVVLRYAENLNADGDIDQGNINTLIKSGEFQTDTYILKGEGKEVWEPRFTYHGFRYVQVTGFPGRLVVENLRGRVVHTALKESGQFECSNELLNKIQRMVRWVTVSNYHSIPTDCPHREKNGWTGDALLSAEQVIYNFDAAAAYTKWMNDLHDAQRPTGQLPGYVPSPGSGYNWGSGPAWDSAYVLIPWYLYQYCGDRLILEEHYDGIKCYVDYMTSLATDNIVSFGLGDWCPPRGGAEGHRTPAAVTSTGYYYADTHILALAAKLLGKNSDARKYNKLAYKIKKSFVEHFYNRETGKIAGEEQTSMACALYQRIIDPLDTKKVFSSLIDVIERCNRHIDCGFLGTKYVMNVLNEYGRNDLAYAIATQSDFPSWGYWVKQGATTLWESWCGKSSRMHHAFSDIGAWFYKALAGIMPDPEHPGFKNIIIRPNPVGDLAWVKAEHISMYGHIRSSWRIEEKRFAMDVTIPPNTTATVYIPAGDAASVMESDRPASDSNGVSFLEFEGDRAVYAVESGTYHFSSDKYYSSG